MFPIGAEVSHLPHVRTPRMLQFIPVDIDCRIGKELVASTVIAMQMGIHDNIYVSGRQVYPRKLAHDIFLAFHDRND